MNSSALLEKIRRYIDGKKKTLCWSDQVVDEGSYRIGYNEAITDIYEELEIIEDEELEEV